MVHVRTGYGTTTPKDKSRQLQRRLCLDAKRRRTTEPDLMWQVAVGWDVQNLESFKNVRFEVAGDGNQDVISQAPSSDPTSGRLNRRR